MKKPQENDLMLGMMHELQSHQKKQAMNNLVAAADNLQAAMEIFQETGLTVQANQVLSILAKIADDQQDARGKPHRPKNPETISDRHTRGLTPERMVENLKHHGIVFNLADDGKADDLLNAELSVEEKMLPSEKDFEDES